MTNARLVWLEKIDNLNFMTFLGFDVTFTNHSPESERR